MSRKFHLSVFVFGVYEKNWEAGEVQDSLVYPCGGKHLLRPSSSYNKLLGRVAFKILSNIHGGALLRK